MPFTSANLKVIYEYLRAMGTSLSASEIARLFRSGQLDDLLAYVRLRLLNIQLYTRAADNVRALLARTDLSPEARAWNEYLLGVYIDEVDRWLHQPDPQERWH